ncbi:hypothetical protein [Sphingobium phenoxybenzoativorans]|uniref:hypothetical protein n=1 Tax=Sphingobium phenoxybenzoativorans TaxID=1592790 RepID=UPI0008733E3E|nr:hypothetical protein [Sphingobium phenoxybenzoativorans]
MSSDIHDQLGRIREYADGKAGAAVERLNGARKAAGESYATARDQGLKAASAANRFIVEHPIAATAAAVAAGALISLLFPRGRAAAKAAPGIATAVGARALAAAKSAKDALEQSEAAEAVRVRAGEAAAAARAKAAELTSTARTALADADIPATVRSRATEAAEAAREAIERARLPERASRLAESAAHKAGDALIAAGKAVNQRLPKA